MKVRLSAHYIRAALLLPVIACPALKAAEIPSGTNFAGNVQFNPAFINSSYVQGTDLAQFSRPNAIPEGEFTTAISLNGSQMMSQKIRFSRQSDGTVAACLPSSLLQRLGVDVDALDHFDDSECRDISTIIPASSAQFDKETQRLVISIPQKYLKHLAKDEVPSSEWDSGVAAAFAAYNVNSYNSKTENYNYESLYASINSGINLAGWYFRHNGAWSSQSGDKGKYNVINSYVQHDITALAGRMLAGQANTTGRLFDTIPFTGVSIFSDDQMLPRSRRGYAPEIRGIAGTHARVTVKQGDAVIYETTVSPGEFRIDDINPSGYGGDLQVIVREADGTEKTFRVPYSSLTDLLRPGVYRYEVVAGKYRSGYSGTDGKPLLQAIWQQGITNLLTMYGGGQSGDGYYSAQIGTAFDTPLGAISADLTHSDTDAGFDSIRGQSYKISYNKLIQETGSNFSLAAYRFSTSGYLDYATAMQYQDLHRHGLGLGNFYHEKERFVLSLQQSLGKQGGSLYLSSLWQDSWNVKGWQQQYTAGYSNNWGRTNYSFALNRARRQYTGDYENTVMFSLSVPLGESSGVMLNAGLNRDNEGKYAEQVGLSGSAGEHNQFNWSAGGSNDSYTGSSGNVSAQYRSSVANMGSGFSINKNSKTVSGNLSGAVVAHPKGVTLTSYNADSYIVVSAPGATGAHLSNLSDVTLDRWGNAVIPAWSPYSRNEVSLDPKGIPTNVELDETSQYSVPRAGAITMASFKTHHGYPLLLSSQGSVVLPFGSNVTNSKGEAFGMVSQGGDIYVRTPTTNGKFYVTWSDGGKSHTCIVPYSIERAEETKPLIRKYYKCAI